MPGTVRTNSELVPGRAENLVQLVGQWTDLGGLAGRRILELGIGFGALSTYLAVTQAPAEITGIDSRADFVEIASGAASELGLAERVHFLQCDMRALHRVGDRFDVAIANNSFIYLPTAADMRKAVDEIARAVRPGGWVILFHANRWVPRDPFTGAPLVHLLPPPVARMVAPRLGWQHSHGRVRLIAPWEMRWRLRRGGFDRVTTGGFVHGEPRRGGIRHRFYATVARRRPAS